MVDRQLTVKCKSYPSFLGKVSVEQCFFHTCISYKHFEAAGMLMGNCPLENVALTANKITRTYMLTRKYMHFEFHQLKRFILISHMDKHINSSKRSTGSIGFKTLKAYLMTDVSHLKSHVISETKNRRNAT